MPAHRKQRSRRASLYTALVVAVAVFAVIIGFGGSSKNEKPTAGVSASPATASPRTVRPSPSRTTPTPTLKPTPKPKPKDTSSGIATSDGSLAALSQRVQDQPVRVRIPAIKVDAPVIPVGVDSSGQLAVPANVFQAAWYQAGSAPGQPGTAIIAAHVDFQGALGLFNKLHTLHVGDPIYVSDVSGKVRRFQVTSGTLAPKSDPSTVQALAEASASPGRSRLALITCGGDLNLAKHSYYDNFVLLADN